MSDTGDQTPEIEAAFVKAVSSWDSGGGQVLDLVALDDGTVLGITEDSIVIYQDMEAVETGEPLPDRPFIPR